MNEHFEFHLETCCKTYSYSYQIIEKLPGTGYKDDGTIVLAMLKLRKDKEDIWIRKLRTLFPYGLCEKAKKKVNDSSVVHEAVGRSFLVFLYREQVSVLPEAGNLVADQNLYFHVMTFYSIRRNF